MQINLKRLHANTIEKSNLGNKKMHFLPESKQGMN